MKYNTFFKLFLIFSLSVMLRAWSIDKSEGLWNDEYVAWAIASKDNFKDFFEAFWSNCHAPLYYLYLKLWLLIFPDTDISLRWSSLLPSVISCYPMFLIGKELKNKTFGCLLAFFAAVSSFLIYFAQEVRFYSLLFLFSSFACLFFIKSAKKTVKKNILIFILLNALICLTHSIGFIFSCFLISFLFLYLFRNFDEYKKISLKVVDIVKYISPFLIVLLLLLPFLFNLYFSHNLSQFWSSFSFSKLYFNFSDYFSPMQINIINSPKSFVEYLYHNKVFNLRFFTFSIIPVLIALFFIIYTLLKRNKILNYMFYACMMYFFVLVVFSLFGRLVLSTKYSIEIYPILILFFLFGFSTFKNKKAAYLLLAVYFILNFYYLIFSNDSAPKLSRPEGNKAVVALLKHSALKPGDKVVLTYYDVDKFKRYLTKNENYRFYSINKFNFNYSVFNNDNYFDVLKNGKYVYRNLFLEFPNKNLEKYYKSNYTFDMKKGEKIGIVFLDSVSFISNKKLQNIVRDDKEYNSYSFIFLVFSTIKNNFISVMSQEFKLYSVTQLGHWTLFVYEKK